MAGEIVRMIAGEPKNIPVLVRGIQMAVARSYREDKFRPTENENKRRVEICLGIARELRMDLHWGIRRICDEMPLALRNKLDGTPWTTAQARRVYVPAIHAPIHGIR